MASLFFPEGMTFHLAVARFNSNVSYSGLLHAVTQDVSYFPLFSGHDSSVSSQSFYVGQMLQ